MHHLPDIIKAIALNNKLDESRDFAAMVQESLVRAAKTNKDLRNRGVKKAPFVVLIGAAMPSVLAEISFLTNKQEMQLLKTAAYKDGSPSRSRRGDAIPPLAQGRSSDHDRR